VAGGRIVITEWRHNGSGFVELANVGGPAVDMATYSDDDDSGARRPRRARGPTP
jgi:hypothetical protein